MHRFTYRAAIAAANMTRKLDASSAQVEYQEVLGRIRAHGLLGDHSFDGLRKKTEEMMQAAEERVQFELQGKSHAAELRADPRKVAALRADLFRRAS